MKRISLLAAGGALTCLAAAPAVTAHAITLKPPATADATFGIINHASRLAASASGVTGFKPVAPSSALENPKIPRALTNKRSPGGPNPAARATGAGATSVSAESAASTRSSVTSSFDGLNDLINGQLYGALTPPDQGLCVGPDHTIKRAPDAVWEVVNQVGRETTKSGAVLAGPMNLPTLFQDP